MVRELLTPEGVPLRIELARAGDRAYAFLLDTMLTTAVSIGVALLAQVVSHASDGFALALLVVLQFALRNFYFMFFEVRWRGQTPGKRMAGIRVTDAGGGPLTAEAVVVRNLTREFEVYLPLALLAAPRVLWPDAPPGAGLFAGVWAFTFALLPIFNRNRQRVGDLLAGTLVVRAPKVLLLDDLGAHAMRARGARYSFTDAQLEVYAIYELQVLEGLLRLGGGPKNQARLRAVAERIQQKIGWQGEADPHWFLRDFYAALRARLEHRLALGERRSTRKP